MQKETIPRIKTVDRGPKNQDIKFGLKDQSDNAHKLKNLIIGS